MTPSFLKAAGENYRDFSTTKVLYIEELQTTLRELTHLPTGALVIHLENDDPENLFSLSFKTLASSSNGAAHILEHTVLCGSKKFPIKDPFFSMNRRSLNTFMNALTGSDFTCYPAATQVEKDFYNLLEVYLDAVFHPLLKELSFLQEGHRLEFADPKDPSSPLEFRGIVFNEMKGGLSSPDTRLWHKMMELLVPNLPYAYNSGGDPTVIPKLTYEELLDFHKTYYHPSRCLFFFYGNFPLKKHLDFLAKNALDKAERAPPLPVIPRQPRFKKPLSHTICYPIEESEKQNAKTILAFGWLTAPLMEQEEVLALSILDSMMMDTDASLLKLSLLQSGLCIQADSHMDTEMSEVPYLVVCKGCEEKDADKIEKLLKNSLEEIGKKGFPLHLVEAAIHQLEFSRTEISGDHSPFGLHLFMRSALAKQHGCPPENSLMIHTLFETLLAKTKDPSYLPGILKKYLWGNPHFVRLIMVPDPKLASEELSQEKKELQKIQEKLGAQESSKILKQTQELSLYQKQAETQTLDCLPKVTLKDVPPRPKDFVLHRESFQDLDVFHHACFTNQIVYADLIFDLPEIAEDEVPLVHILTSLLSEVGTAKRSWTENLEYLHAHTGGLGGYCALHIQASDPTAAKPCLHLRGKALYRKADKLFSLLRETALSLCLDDEKRIKEVLLQINSSLQNRLNRNALRYAIQLAVSGFSIPAKINNDWDGLPYFKTIQEIVSNLDSKLPFLIEKLRSFKERLFCLKNPHLVLSCDEQMYAQLKKEAFYGLADMKLKDFSPWRGNYSLLSVNSQARLVSSPVASTVRAFKTIGYLHPHAPGLTASTLLLDNKVLHPCIREQGGAYGSGATFSPTHGYFYFYSYRDPHINKTLKTFESALFSIAKKQFTGQDLEEAKLGIIQQLDQPVSPGSRASLAYSWWRAGKTVQMRENFRTRFLSLTEQAVQQAIEEELLSQSDKGITISFANKDLLEKENAHLSQEKAPLPILSI